jgi:hypothetical protein
MRIHTGALSDFATATCYDFDAIDNNESGIAAELTRWLTDQKLSLRKCTSTEDRRLILFYQAGRGVCVDCGSTGAKWSGFAFITVSDRSGHEFASAEWSGGAASNGIQLVRRFADDLLALVSGKN